MLSIREFRKIQEPGTRRCSKCGEIKPIEEFVKAKNTPDGRMSRCKVCHRKQNNSHNKEYVQRPEVRKRKTNSTRMYRQRETQKFMNSYPKASGFIYVFKWKEFYKIGYAKHPKSRVKAIDASLPFNGELVCVIPTNGMIRAEEHLHKLFSHLRRGGEWFELLSDDVSSLCAIAFIQVNEGQVTILKD